MKGDDKQAAAAAAAAVLICSLLNSNHHHRYLRQKYSIMKSPLEIKCGVKFKTMSSLQNHASDKIAGSQKYKNKNALISHSEVAIKISAVSSSGP